MEVKKVYSKPQVNVTQLYVSDIMNGSADNYVEWDWNDVKEGEWL